MMLRSVGGGEVLINHYESFTDFVCILKPQSCSVFGRLSVVNSVGLNGYIESPYEDSK